MGKQRNTTLILGEGPTEFFYFKSLCDELKGLTIKPDYPNHRRKSRDYVGSFHRVKRSVSPLETNSFMV